MLCTYLYVCVLSMYDVYVCVVSMLCMYVMRIRCVCAHMYVGYAMYVCMLRMYVCMPRMCVCNVRMRMYVVYATYVMSCMYVMYV